MNNKTSKFIISLLFLASFTLILGNLKRIISTTAPDYRVLWISAKDMLTSNNPYTDKELYTPNAYPPISELFYLPLAVLPYQPSQAVFIFLSFSSIIGSVFLSIKLIYKKVAWQHFLLFTALALLSFPTKFSLGMGQINLIVLFLLLLAYYFQQKNKQIISGSVLGISIILKPIFIFFLIFFILKKKWKMVLTSIFTVTFAILATVIFWPVDYWFSWFKTGILPLANLAGREAYCNQGLMGFISRIFSDLQVRKYLTLALSLLLTLIPSVLTLKRKNENLILSLFIITLLFVDSASWQHHFVWLMFPLIAVSQKVFLKKNAVFKAFIWLAYFLASWNFKNPFPYPPIIISNQFYSALILWAINIYLLLKDGTNNRRIGIYR